MARLREGFALAQARFILAVERRAAAELIEDSPQHLAILHEQAAGR